MANSTDQYDPPEGPPPSRTRRNPIISEMPYANFGDSGWLELHGWGSLDLSKAGYTKSETSISHSSAPSNPFSDPSSVNSEIPEPLWPLIEGLFNASKQFFELPREYKQRYKTDAGSEEGWSGIRGEKEFITIRRHGSHHCPNELREPVEKAWGAIFPLLAKYLQILESSLGQPAQSLTQFAESCLKLDNVRRPTMLRLFRYENNTAKIVAEPHNDLGLLSLVVGDKPGLEVWNKPKSLWNPLEITYKQGNATLLTGRQLEHFSNGRYLPGAHRVVSYGPNNTGRISRAKRIVQKVSGVGKPKEQFRYSIVFVLRADSEVKVDYQALRTPITGQFLNRAGNPRENTTAGDVFEEIHKAHFNINTNLQERATQKQRLTEKKTLEKSSWDEMDRVREDHFRQKQKEKKEAKEKGVVAQCGTDLNSDLALDGAFKQSADGVNDSSEGQTSMPEIQRQTTRERS